MAGIDPGKPAIVAVCGGADLGKSFLSERLVDHFLQRNISAGHLTMDSFLLDRPERTEAGLSGYQVESYDFPKIHAALGRFRQRQPISFAQYGHFDGRKGDTQILEPCTILVLDGLHSMHETILPYVDYSIFIYADESAFKKIRFDADLTKRRLSVEVAGLNTEPEFLLYKKLVAPYRQNANIQLLLQKKWEYVAEGDCLATGSDLSGSEAAK